MKHSEIFKAIKWYTGDSYYDGAMDYLHILQKKDWLKKILETYKEYIKGTLNNEDQTTIETD